MEYQQINAETIDRWVEEGWEWGRPISHEAYLAACSFLILFPNRSAGSCAAVFGCWMCMRTPMEWAFSMSTECPASGRAFR